VPKMDLNAVAPGYGDRLLAQVVPEEEHSEQLVDVGSASHDSALARRIAPSKCSKAQLCKKRST
jgi:hypothetical protein